MTTTPLTDQQLAAELLLKNQLAAAFEHMDAYQWGYDHGFCGEYGVDPETDSFVDTALALVRPELDRLAAENAELSAELGDRDEKARKRWIKNQEKQLGLKYADFRTGRWEMDLAMGREMAAAYVAMAKTLLGDAPNYSETKLEFDVKIAESPETYTLVVQRHAPGALTPHEARQRAEAGRDELAAELGRVRAKLATLRRITAEHITASIAIGSKADAESAAVSLEEQLDIHDVDLTAEYAALDAAAPAAAVPSA